MSRNSHPPPKPHPAVRKLFRLTRFAVFVRNAAFEFSAAPLLQFVNGKRFTAADRTLGPWLTSPRKLNRLKSPRAKSPQAARPLCQLRLPSLWTPAHPRLLLRNRRRPRLRNRLWCCRLRSTTNSSRDFAPSAARRYWKQWRIATRPFSPRIALGSRSLPCTCAKQQN